MAYHLQVSQGVKSSETGFFFVAAPFEIKTASAHYSVNLEKNAKHKPVYIIKSNNTVVYELTHNDYCLDVEAKEAPTPEVFAALVQLGITNSKEYKTYFSNPETLAKLSFEVSQNDFLK